MQQIIIENQIFEVLDIKEKVTIADSFVVPDNKIGGGNGEAKLYVGQNNEELRKFFGTRPFNIKCFLLKKDLIQYLDDTKTEYLFPEQPYRRKELLPSLWQKRQQFISSFTSNIIEFEVAEQDQITPPRIYVNSKDKNYQILRLLSIPNITYISILKLKRIATNEIVFYFRLFADYFGEAIHPARIIEEEAIVSNELIEPQQKVQIRNSRRGHGEYRKKLLDQCPFCPITMITDDRLLIASHIKPWVVSNNFEKTDPFNGFMLSPTYDYLFDRGFMSFTDDKRTILSPFLSKMTYSKIGISDDKLVPMLPIQGREEYLEYHRQNIFKTAGDI